MGEEAEREDENESSKLKVERVFFSSSTSTPTPFSLYLSTSFSFPLSSAPHHTKIERKGGSYLCYKGMVFFVVRSLAVALLFSLSGKKNFLGNKMKLFIREEALSLIIDKPSL